jgi:hypothetical protein
MRKECMELSPAYLYQLLDYLSLKYSMFLVSLLNVSYKARSSVYNIQISDRQIIDSEEMP